MLWPLSVVLVANTNGRLAIPALAGLLVGKRYYDVAVATVKERSHTVWAGKSWSSTGYVVSQQQKAASLHDDIQFGAIDSSFWSATRLGP